MSTAVHKEKIFFLEGKVDSNRHVKATGTTGYSKSTEKSRHASHHAQRKKIQKRVRPGTLLGYDMPQYSYILKNV